MAYSWCSVLGRGVTQDFNFLIYGILKTCMSQRFRNEFWKRMAWSFYWLYQGVRPLADWNNRFYTAADPEYAMRGQPLAGGFFGVLWGLKQDLEHLCDEFGFARWNTLNPCPKCDGDRNDIRDFSRDPSWRGKVWGNRAWRLAKGLLNPIFDVPGVTLATVWLDLMHCKHLGTDAWFLGSVLWVLMREGAGFWVGSRSVTQY